jgi:hypothetical protein
VSRQSTWGTCTQLGFLDSFRQQESTVAACSLLSTVANAGAIPSLTPTYAYPSYGAMYGRSIETSRVAAGMPLIGTNGMVNMGRRCSVGWRDCQPQAADVRAERHLHGPPPGQRPTARSLRFDALYGCERRARCCWPQHQQQQHPQSKYTPLRRHHYTKLSTIADQVTMQLENILMLTIGIPTLLVAVYGIYIARRTSARQSRFPLCKDNLRLRSTC